MDKVTVKVMSHSCKMADITDQEISREHYYQFFVHMYHCNAYNVAFVFPSSSKFLVLVTPNFLILNRIEIGRKWNQIVRTAELVR